MLIIQRRLHETVVGTITAAEVAAIAAADQSIAIEIRVDKITGARCRLGMSGPMRFLRGELPPRTDVARNVSSTRRVVELMRSNGSSKTDQAADARDLAERATAGRWDVSKTPSGRRQVVSVESGELIAIAGDNPADADLIAAAPEILAERDRLREENRRLRERLRGVAV